MARTGDALGYYYEEGFIQEDYHVYEPYIEEGYVEANYFQEQTLGEIQEASADLSVVFTQNTQSTRIKQFAVDLGALFSPNITARATRLGDVDLFVDTAFTATGSRIRDNDVTLDNIVNLSLQAAKVISTQSNLSSTATLAADAEIAILFAADLNSQFAQTASAIKFQSNTYGDRPRPYTIDANTPTISTATNKIGAGSLQIDKYDRLSVPASTDFGELRTIDFWVYPDIATGGADNANILSWGEAISGSPNNEIFVSLVRDAAGNYNLRIQITGDTPDDDPDDDFRAYLSSDVSWHQAWHHVRAQRHSNGWHVWLDGVKDTPQQNDTIENLPSAITTEPLKIGDRYFGSDPGRVGDFYLDELLITRSTLTSTSTNTFTPPTTEWSGFTQTQQSNTVILLSHFDEDFSDDISAKINAASTLNSTATLAALGGAGFDGAAELATATTLTAGADKTSSTGATLAGEFTQTATGEFVPLEFSAALNSAATITLSAGTIKTAQSEINTIFSQTTSSGAIRRAATSLNSVFAQNAVISRFAGADTTLNAQADLNSQVTRIKQFAADLGALFSPNVTAIAQMTGEVLIQNEFTLASDNLRIRPGSADFAAINSQLAIAVVVASGSIELDTNTNMSTLADKFSGSQAAIASESELAATPTRIKQFASDQASVATIDTQATVVTEITLEAASEFTQTATAGAQRDFAVDFASIATTLTAGARIASFIVDPITQFEQSTTAQRLRAVESVQQVNAQLAAIIGELKSFDLAVDSEFTLDEQASKLTQTGAQLESRGLFGLTARATASGAVDLDSASELTAAATVTRGATATQLSEFELLGAADRKVSGGAALSLAAELAATIGVIADFAAQLNSAAEISVGGNLIIVDRVIFTIPREDTTYTIDPETRAHLMHQETRAYTIEGEQ